MEHKHEHIHSHDHGHDHEHEHGDACSCGHDHGHDHDHHSHAHEHDHHHEHEHSASCDCGHDHSHDHDHDHSGACGCGHDHDHGETCDCGHDHSHDHSHEEPETRGEVKVERHEGALICSITFDVDGEFDDVSGKLAKLMEDFAAEIDEAGGIVGHIKAFMTGDRRGAMLSTTGGAVTVRPSDPHAVTVNFVAIAFVEDEAAFIQKVANLPTLL